MNRIAKALKWGASALRVLRVRIVAGNRLKIASGKPLYLGKGTRLILGEGASLSIGAGVYLSPECIVQVNKGATLVLEDGVYMNEGCRVTVVESARIGADTLLGPNVQIYDHDHEFDRRGLARSYSTRRFRSVIVVGFALIRSLRAAARLRVALLFQRTLLSRATLTKRALCTPGRPLG